MRREITDNGTYGYGDWNIADKDNYWHITRHINGVKAVTIILPMGDVYGRNLDSLLANIGKGLVVL